MKRTFPIAAALIALTALSGCTAVRSIGSRNENPYAQPLFYEKYLAQGNPLDDRIAQTLEALRQDPGSARLHNELGSLLVAKGFPKDAEREFERALDADRKYYGAWYNLGLTRASRGDEDGARRALRRTVALKPGHGEALFQLGLLEEKRDHIDRALAYYTKAFRINPQLLQVRRNPQILDTKLADEALILLYPARHVHDSMNLQDAPVVYVEAPPAPIAAPSNVPVPQQIVPPAPSATDPSMQQATPSAAPVQTESGRTTTRRRRPRRVQPQQETVPPVIETTPEQPPVEEQPVFTEPVDPNAPPVTEDPALEIPPDQVPPEEEEPAPPPPV